MASGGPAPLARMYREQLCRRARSIGTVGLLPELNGLSFETEEYYYYYYYYYHHYYHHYYYYYYYYYYYRQAAVREERRVVEVG